VEFSALEIYLEIQIDVTDADLVRLGKGVDIMRFISDHLVLGGVARYAAFPQQGGGRYGG
jgi:hypothetical protein